MNSKGQFYCHLRHRNKAWCPHHWTLAFGGAVGYTETYDINAYKELEEEAGVKGVKLHPLFTFKYETIKNKAFQKVYYAKYDGEVKF